MERLSRLFGNEKMKLGRLMDGERGDVAVWAEMVEKWWRTLGPGQ